MNENAKQNENENSITKSLELFKMLENRISLMESELRMEVN